jgi:hypothetical protein
MKNQKIVIIDNALHLAKETKSNSTFLFLNTAQSFNWFLKTELYKKDNIVIVISKELKIRDAELKGKNIKVIRSWSGNQTRFSRIKYAFLHGVLQRLIQTDSRVVCVLGPWGKSHLDTIAIHDLSLSWAEEFPFDPKSIMDNEAFTAVLAVVDIALDIGALGREGKPIGTVFVIGDKERVMKLSHQAVFNPFKGYPKRERLITRSEVVESIKELAKLDGAFVITESSIVLAAGRHLDARGAVTKQLRGLGSRHRAAAGITRMTSAIAVVVSESTGRVTIFEKGRIISTLEPVISSRLV